LPEQNQQHNKRAVPGPFAVIAKAIAKEIAKAIAE
jgi:hypothetical protein